MNSDSKKKIVLTGGGTAGHVTPNIALIPELESEGYEVHYIGSYEGIESVLIPEQNIPYYGISSGKLRRYFDPKNFSDPFKVIKGYFQAKQLLKTIRPNVVFSKGGFVSVPVVLAAKRCHIPAIIHESDMTPGLANRIAIPSASKVCANFPETVHSLPENKAVLTGTPIRKELFEGNKEKGLQFCGFNDQKPVLMIIGGSLGSVAVNTAVRSILPALLEKFQVIHLCGKDKLDESLTNTPGYVQFEYVKDELTHLFAAADILISRAGANAICEILALRKPNILIPLSAQASRGDQILNANSFEKQGFSKVIMEEEVTDELLLKTVNDVYDHKDAYIEKMNQSPLSNATREIVSLIKNYALQ
ncbi:MAG: undecaprenyldiphospho-muramoylpentapeptide beta-N-acetylglucosaminyltransferase [Lachnospiraceae bacterium]|nr:undecaprenyldiphospho-muramoylpentapeptide beta-N-acetylglucosaminyltransferase [Lachnospiraceae bacterium]